MDIERLKMSWPSIEVAEIAKALNDFHHKDSVGRGPSADSYYRLGQHVVHRFCPRSSTAWNQRDVVFRGRQRTARDFNKPYHCIDVRAHKSSAGLKSMSPEEWQKAGVVWFDYDGTFDADVKDDCEMLLQNLHPGSVLLTTVYADKRAYKPAGPVDKTTPALTKLRQLFGDAVPATAVAPGKNEIEADEFPGVLAVTVINFMTGVVRRSGRVASGQPVVFVPLFNLQHRDGGKMATVGGMIAAPEHLASLRDLLLLTDAQLLSGMVS